MFGSATIWRCDEVASASKAADVAVPLVSDFEADTSLETSSVLDDALTVVELDALPELRGASRSTSGGQEGLMWSSATATAGGTGHGFASVVFFFVLEDFFCLFDLRSRIMFAMVKRKLVGMRAKDSGDEGLQMLFSLPMGAAALDCKLNPPPILRSSSGLSAVDNEVGKAMTCCRSGYAG